MTQGVPAHFHRANFLELPYAPASFDVILLLSIMYSAIPGAAQRQKWLAELGRLLTPNGLVMLSFLREPQSVSRQKVVYTRLNMMLVNLPGANMAYQPGDEWSWGHFYHAFQDEDEIRRELVGAGVMVRELHWTQGLALVV